MLSNVHWMNSSGNCPYDHASPIYPERNVRPRHSSSCSDARHQLLHCTSVTILMGLTAGVWGPLGPKNDQLLSIFKASVRSTALISRDMPSLAPGASATTAARRFRSISPCALERSSSCLEASYPCI